MVECALRDYLPARNCDKVLQKYIWKKYFKKFLILDKKGKVLLPIDNLHYLPSESTLGRNRRLIQNGDGAWRPTIAQVYKKRQR